MIGLYMLLAGISLGIGEPMGFCGFLVAACERLLSVLSVVKKSAGGAS